MNVSKRMRSLLQRYDHEKYWDMRDFVQNNPNCSFGKGKLKLLRYVCRIKKIDYRFHASTGISLDGDSAQFASRPTLPHELNGIIIAKGAKIGKNARIFHQVTIGNDDHDHGHVPVIGDDVHIYPGAKIVGNVHIGDRCIIGANAVVVEDVPDDTLVVVPKPRMLRRNANQDNQDHTE